MVWAAAQVVTEADILELQSSSNERPVGRIVAQSAQLLTDNTAQAMAFGSGSNSIDTHGFHSETVNTSRITPDVPGIYRFYGTFVMGSVAIVFVEAWFRKNGIDVAPSDRQNQFSTTAVRSCNISVMLEMNGTTDYVEFVVIQDSAGNNNSSVSGRNTSVVEWEKLRDLE